MTKSPLEGTPSALLVEPAYLTHPDFGETLGPEVADVAVLAGFPPDPEQKLGLDLIFALDGQKSAAFEFCVVCSRQNLKTGLFKQAALGWLFVTNQHLIVWSAHEFPTAREAHRDMAELVTNSDYLRRLVKKVYYGAGDESIELLSGQRLVFKARTHTGGKGLSAPKVVLDEAFALKPSHMGSLMPTMSVQPDPQLVYGSSAGYADSAILRGVRDRGRAGSSPRLAYMEWCAAGSFKEPGCEFAQCDHLVGSVGCALDSVENWASANPLLGRTRANGTGLTVQYVADERQGLAAAPLEFARERLGWWEDPAEVGGPPISVKDWQNQTDPASEPIGPVVFSAEIATDRRSASIAVAGRRADGSAHVGVVDHRQGTDWCLPRLLQLTKSHRTFEVERGSRRCSGLVVDPGSPAVTLVDPLRDAGVEPVLMTARDVHSACAGLQDAVSEGDVWHHESALLDAALGAAVKRPMGDGGWAFGRKKSLVDITPLVAVTNALWLLELAPTGEPAVYVF